MPSEKRPLARKLATAGLVAAAGLLTGCGVTMRAPVCARGVFELPPGATGHYRYWSTEQVSAYGGANVVTSSVDVTITDEGPHFGLTVSGRLPKLVGARRLAAPATLKHARVDAEDDPPDTGDGACKIGDTYYWQFSGTHGDYSVARVGITDVGMSFTALAFAPEELDRAGLKYVFLPTFDGFSSAAGASNFFMTDETAMIVDNAQLDAGQQRALLALARPTAIGMNLTRVTDGPKARGGRSYRLRKP